MPSKWMRPTPSYARRDRGREVGGDGGHAEHAAARGHQAALPLGRCPRGTPGRRRRSRPPRCRVIGLARRVAPGIAAGGDRHAHRGPFRRPSPLAGPAGARRGRPRPAAAPGRSSIAHHERLALGVAEAAVELDHLRPRRRQHEADVEHAAVRARPRRPARPASGSTIVSMTRASHRGVDGRHRRERAHAARVGPAVAVEHGLVVLGRRQRPHAAAPASTKNETSSPRMNSSTTTVAPASPNVARSMHWAIAASASSSVAHTIAPLPAARPSVFTTHGAAELAAEAAGRRGVVERREARGRDAVLGHQPLGERLGALDRRGPPAGAEDGEAPAAQPIGEPRHQRRLGADDHQVDVAAPAAKPASPVGVVDADSTQRGVARDPGLPGAAYSVLDERALRDLPGERVLAAAAADEQDLSLRRIPRRAPRPRGARARCGPTGCRRPAPGSAASDRRASSARPARASAPARLKWASA